MSIRGLAVIIAVGAFARGADAGVRLDHCVLSLGGTRAVATGRIDPKLDLRLTLDRWRFGEFEARDIAIEVHENQGGVRTCATARVDEVAVEACGTLARSYSEVRAVTWKARARTWTAHGEGAVTRDGRVSAHAVFEAAATVEVDVAGSASDLSARGELRAAGIKIPFVARGNLREGRIDSLVASVLGGELSLEPVTPRLDQPLVLAWHARGLALDRMLPDRIQGTGLVDGDLAVRLEGGHLSLLSAGLHARTAGRLRVREASWLPRGTDLKARIAGALADFEFSQLAATIAPPGGDADIRLAIRGRGRSVAQDLDLVVNLHGVRDIAPRLLRYLGRES